MKVLRVLNVLIIDPGDKRTVMITNTISDRNVDIHSLDIAVNAVATAVAAALLFLAKRQNVTFKISSQICV